VCKSVVNQRRKLPDTTAPLVHLRATAFSLSLTLYLSSTLALYLHSRSLSFKPSLSLVPSLSFSLLKNLSLFISRTLSRSLPSSICTSETESRRREKGVTPRGKLSPLRFMGSGLPAYGERINVVFSVYLKHGPYSVFSGGISGLISSGEMTLRQIP